MESNIVFIVWARHSRRAQTLAAELGGHVSFQYEAGLKGRWLTPIRYLAQGWNTWRALQRARAATVIVQSPPIFALLVVAVWCAWRKLGGQHVSYAIDCHTGTFYDRRWRWALPLLRLLAHTAVVTLVASEEAQKMLQRWEVNNLFLMDGLPSFDQPVGMIGTQGTQPVAVISGFGLDEPVAEILEAARLLPHVTFYFSGDPQRLPAVMLAQKPGNVVFTGFLQECEYAALLNNVHGIVNLTTAANILTCGTYEALAVGKPVVASGHPQMKRYFGRGFIYVRNTPESIAAGICKMLDERKALTEDVLAMRAELVRRRQPAFEKLAAILQS